jgi:ketosteroid isomerase-like protein
MALGVSGLWPSRPSLAAPSDQATIDQAVAKLRAALLAADRSKLEDLASEELSYGLYPEGHVQGCGEFIASIVDKKTIYRSIMISEPRTMVAGDTAIVRHREAIEADVRSKHYSVEFEVLQVWKKQDGRWRLLARQGFKT